MSNLAYKSKTSPGTGLVVLDGSRQPTGLGHGDETCRPGPRQNQRSTVGVLAVTNLRDRAVELHAVTNCATERGLLPLVVGDLGIDHL